MLRNPGVKYEHIAGLEDAKHALYDAIILPKIRPDIFKGIRRPPMGVLMYGPPGTGKTLLAKAVATTGNTTFFAVGASSLASKWRGESEKMLRYLFEMARFYAPSTIFFDEIDSLFSKRQENENEGSRRVKSEMLTQMDGVNNYNTNSTNEDGTMNTQKNVIVIAATNLPWDLDEALLRRLERRVYIPLPDKLGRKQLFEINLKKEELQSEFDWDKLVELTEGYSGHDINNLCREAAMVPIYKIQSELGYAYLEKLESNI